MIVDPVTEDEVFERLRAGLSSEGLVLHRGHLDGMAADVIGRFYLTKAGSPDIVENDVDIERRARAMDLLKPNEALVPAHGEGI